MKNILIKSSLILITLLFVNCSSSDDSMGPVPDPDPDPIANPNPNKTTTYDADIKAIMDDKCLRCHTIPLQNAAPFPMRNYAETIIGVNRGLIDNVAVSVNNVMPPEGRLPQEMVDMFLDWEADGFLEK